MSRPTEYEIRGAVHAFKQYDKYGRPYMPLSDWKSEIGTIIYRVCNDVEVMICGGKDNCRALLYANPTLTGDDVLRVIDAMENGGYYIRAIPIREASIGNKVGLYFSKDKAGAEKRFFTKPIPTWISSLLVQRKLEVEWWLMFDS